MLRLDLHVHTEASPDGSLSHGQIGRLLGKDLDYIAITDHNTIDNARRLKRLFGSRIIIGEEISTASGDLIGLFLKQRIKPHLPLRQTIDEIKRQGGLVYVPHPGVGLFYRRASLTPGVIRRYRRQIDIIEGFNARGLPPIDNWLASRLANQLSLPAAAASDAHGLSGIPSAYTLVSRPPTAKNLPHLIKRGRQHRRYQSIRGYLEPHKNRQKLIR